MKNQKPSFYFALTLAASVMGIFSGCTSPILSDDSTRALASSATEQSQCIPDEEQLYENTGTGLRVSAISVNSDAESDASVEITITMSNVETQGAYNYPAIGLRIDDGDVTFAGDAASLSENGEESIFWYYGIEPCGSYETTFLLERNDLGSVHLSAFVSSDLGETLQDEVQFMLPPSILTL